MLGKWRVDKDNKEYTIVDNPDHTYRINNFDGDGVPVGGFEAVSVEVTSNDGGATKKITLQSGCSVDVPKGFYRIIIKHQGTEAEGTYEVVGV